jgi:predicted nucleic acid-binding protein
LSAFHAHEWHTAFTEVHGAEIREFDIQVYQEAERLWRQHQDKDWDLIDCYSFATMRRENIRRALTFDRHFSQAGFQIFPDPSAG